MIVNISLYEKVVLGGIAAVCIGCFVMMYMLMGAVV